MWFPFIRQLKCKNGANICQYVQTAPSIYYKTIQGDCGTVVIATGGGSCVIMSVTRGLSTGVTGRQGCSLLTHQCVMSEVNNYYVSIVPCCTGGALTDMILLVLGYVCPSEFLDWSLRTKQLITYYLEYVLKSPNVVNEL